MKLYERSCILELNLPPIAGTTITTAPQSTIEKETTEPPIAHVYNKSKPAAPSSPTLPPSTAPTVPPAPSSATVHHKDANSSAGTSKVLIALVVVFSLMALGLGGYLLWGNKENSDSEALAIDSVDINTTSTDSLQTDTVLVEDVAKDVYASLLGIGTIHRDDIAANAVPMLLDPTAKGDFYDRAQVEPTDSIGDYTYGIVLYRGKEKLCSFTTDARYDSPDGAKLPSKKQLAKGHIENFTIYSPTIKMQDGIHVGMSANELVKKHHAKIFYLASPEVDYLCFKFSSYPDNFRFIASGEILKTDFVEDESGCIEEELSLKEVRGCKLVQINF